MLPDDTALRFIARSSGAKGRAGRGARYTKSMDDLWPHHICGLDELSAAPLTSARRVVSILDTAAAQPAELADFRGDLLTLRFDDVLAPIKAYRPPARDDIEQLLAFDRNAHVSDRLVIHCTAGISRSTAAFVVLRAQRSPATEAAVFDELRAIRPRAWPNSLMVALADDILGAEGRLVHELREHYKVQLRLYPEIGRLMIGLGREREIPFDRLIPDARSQI